MSLRILLLWIYSVTQDIKQVNSLNQFKSGVGK